MNPLAAADLPAFRALGGGARPVLDGAGEFVVRGAGLAARPVDANLGVDGLPQSGTGQAALLTGVNAPELFGRHFGPWVPTAIQGLVARENIFQRLVHAGVEPAFANVAPGGLEGARRRTARRPGAFPFATLAAGLPVRDEADLRAGRGLVSSITTEGWREAVDPLGPIVPPEEAGRVLANISLESRFAAFAHWDTDYVGHRGTADDALAALTRVDAFLTGLLEHLHSDTLLVLTSDHGNLEDLTVTTHTRNPVPFYAFGPSAGWLCERVEALTDIAPLFLELLEIA